MRFIVLIILDIEEAAAGSCHSTVTLTSIVRHIIRFSSGRRQAPKTMRFLRGGTVNTFASQPSQAINHIVYHQRFYMWYGDSQFTQLQLLGTALRVDLQRCVLQVGCLRIQAREVMCSLHNCYNIILFSMCSNCCFRYIIILSTLDNQLAKCSKITVQDNFFKIVP